MSNDKRDAGQRFRVGLVVAFAALGDAERQSVEVAWGAATEQSRHWEPAFAAYGLEPVTEQAKGADILVYLGESSRFAGVAGEASRHVPVLLVKSTVASLLDRPEGAAPRYRMCTSVAGIARALASVAPIVPTVAWNAVPWPESVAHYTHLDEAEGSYVQTSVNAFRSAAAERGIDWLTELPPDGQLFSIFLTMHDPAAATLAHTALTLWPQCTVLAADGMVSQRAPDGSEWPDRLARVRHWTARSDSESNRAFGGALQAKPLPDFDSSGMVFGTLYFLDHAFAAGAAPGNLEAAGGQPGPLGPMRMTPSGRPDPERVVVFQGDRARAIDIT